MVATKKTKSKSTARPAVGRKKAASANTALERNGIILFTLLAIGFMLLAAAKYM